MIHEKAIIESGASVGQDVSIGPFSMIEAGATVGDHCVIGPHVTIMKHVTLGPNCRVHAGAVIGDLPQDLGFKDGESFVRVGAGCTLREGVTIHRGTKPGTATELGEGCFLMAFSHCAHNVKLGNRVIMANGSLLGGYVEVGDGAFISGNCMVHQFCRVGRLAMLGGGGCASKDVPPFVTLRTCSFNEVLGLNVVGLRRAGVDSGQRKEIKQAFRTVYASGLNVSQAVEKIRGTFASGPALEFCEFIETSKRGICGGGGVEEVE